METCVSMKIVNENRRRNYVFWQHKETSQFHIFWLKTEQLDWVFLVASLGQEVRCKTGHFMENRGGLCAIFPLDSEEGSVSSGPQSPTCSPTDSRSDCSRCCSNCSCRHCSSSAWTRFISAGCEPPRSPTCSAASFSFTTKLGKAERPSMNNQPIKTISRIIIALLNSSFYDFLEQFIPVLVIFYLAQFFYFLIIFTGLG